MTTEGQPIAGASEVGDSLRVLEPGHVGGRYRDEERPEEGAKGRIPAPR